MPIDVTDSAHLGAPVASMPDPDEHAFALLVEALRLANDRQTVPLALLREALVYLGLDGSASLRVDAVECVPVGWTPCETVEPAGLDPSPW